MVVANGEGAALVEVLGAADIVDEKGLLFETDPVPKPAWSCDAGVLAPALEKGVLLWAEPMLPKGAESGGEPKGEDDVEAAENGIEDVSGFFWSLDGLSASKGLETLYFLAIFATNDSSLPCHNDPKKVRKGPHSNYTLSSLRHTHNHTLYFSSALSIPPSLSGLCCLKIVVNMAL